MILLSQYNLNTTHTYGPFAIKREETARKKIFELMPILDIFQPKNHIWHINVTLIFFSSFPPFYCKGPISSFLYKKTPELLVANQKNTCAELKKVHMLNQ